MYSHKDGRKRKAITMLKETTVFYVVPSEDVYVFFGEDDEKPDWFDDRPYPVYQGIAYDTACKNNWGIPMKNNYIELYDGEKVTLEPGEHLLKMDSKGNVKIIK